MVRLKECVDINRRCGSMEFQFQNGAIKRYAVNMFETQSGGFNSKMVRLKVKFQRLFINIIFCFNSKMVRLKVGNPFALS